MRHLDIALRRGQRMLQALDIQPDAIRRLGALEPPAFGQRAGIDRVVPELIQQAGDDLLGLGIVARDRQRAPVGRARGRGRVRLATAPRQPELAGPWFAWLRAPSGYRTNVTGTCTRSTTPACTRPRPRSCRSLLARVPITIPSQRPGAGGGGAEMSPK
ncbi:MAG: hypothetical protein IPM01_13345 [Burkholderiaceae bacterium]|nr:hypothetical protein [Burkholderiaceae bacterium]